MKKAFFSLTYISRSIVLLLMLLMSNELSSQTNILTHHPRLLFTKAEEPEVKLLYPESVVSWIAATEANVEINGNLLHLTQNGKHFYMEIVSPLGAAFKTYPAKNSFEAEYPISGINMIETECAFGRAKGKIVVRMSSRSMLAENRVEIK